MKRFGWIALAAAVLTGGCSDSRKESDSGQAESRPASAASAGVPGPGPATALEGARDYVRLLKARLPAEAAQTYWDWGVMLEAIFGEKLAKYSPPERQEMVRLMTGTAADLFAAPELVETMANGSYDPRAQGTLANGDQVIRLGIGGKTPDEDSVLIFRQIAGRWRVVDTGTMGEMLIQRERQAFAMTGPGMEPMAYVREMAAGMKKGIPRPAAEPPASGAATRTYEDGTLGLRVTYPALWQAEPGQTKEGTGFQAVLNEKAVTVGGWTFAVVPAPGVPSMDEYLKSFAQAIAVQARILEKGLTRLAGKPACFVTYRTPGDDSLTERALCVRLDAGRIIVFTESATSANWGRLAGTLAAITESVAFKAP